MNLQIAGQTALVNNDVLEHLKSVSMSWTPQGYISVQYTTPDGRRVRQQLHNHIFTVIKKNTIPAGMLLHHINDMRWDNRMENLELTTQEHNTAAVDKKSDKSTSQFKGVDWDHKAQQWRAQMSVSRKNYFLGYFPAEFEAARAYDRAFLAVHDSINGCNSVLTLEEIEEVKSNQDHFKPKAKRADRKLPTHISLKDGKFYRVVIEKQKFPVVRKQFPTLEEAVKFRDDKLQEMQDQKQQAVRAISIRRNRDGFAIIPVKIFKSDLVVYALVSDEDYYELVQETWYLNQGGYAWSFRRGEMHTSIINNDDKTKVIDHADRDKLDNRRENLRVVTRCQNSCNKRKRSASKYPGVSKCAYKYSTLWVTKITIEKRQVHVGYFDTEEKANEAYEQKHEGISQTMAPI
jgi:hypothetical protein